MVGSDAEAAVEYIQETQPDASISFRDCFYKIERNSRLLFDMAEISEIVGRDMDPNTFLVSMSTYYGQIVVGDDRVEIIAD